MSGSLISKFVASTVSIPNELSLAAANFNLDFTLMKVEAPNEFKAVQNSLSPFRREEAEVGSLHRTARKLGALFHDVVSVTPALLSAYGTRVSQIAEKQKLEPSERKKHGIFSYISGTDSSNIWAAATSGNNAIAVHLLACMVAAIFDAPQAVAIWTELVDRRKSEVENKIDQERDLGKATAFVMAAKQQITREELAIWDNGARAWLQSANFAMKDQRDRALTYTDGAATNVNKISDVYLSVTRAWEDAVVSMDSLVRGVPQKVRNGAVLLAMNSWHLYPDLCVLSRGPDVVAQHDDLIMKSGILSIDLEQASDSTQSVSWSLPLSFMRYYGDPVIVESRISVDSARLTMEQFCYVVFGCATSAWTGFAKSTSEIIDVMYLVMQAIRQPERSSHGETEVHRMKKILGDKSWVGQLCTTVRDWKDFKDNERAVLEKLIGLGHRHWRFLCDLPHHPAPVFGLSHFPSLFSLLNGSEARIACLRQLSQDHGLSNQNFVIFYLDELSNGWTLATIAPIDESFGAGNGTNSSRPYVRRPFPAHRDTSKHARWLVVDTSVASCACKSTCIRPPDKTESPGGKTNWQQRIFKSKKTGRGADLAQYCSCMPTKNRSCSLSCHTWSPSASCTSHLRADSTAMEARISHVQQRGEYCLAAHRMTDPNHKDNGLIDFGNGLDFEASLTALSNTSNRSGELFVSLSFYAGDSKTAMIVSSGGPAQSSGTGNRDQRTGRPGLGGDRKELGHYTTINALREALRSGDFNHRLLTDWFTTHLRNSHRSYIKSLRACAAAFNLYRNLPNTTVSSTVVPSLSLAEARWFPTTEPPTASPLAMVLSRAEAFSCIAMFEAGKTLEPAYLSAVFAMTSGDSIYVASQLLEDPYEVPKPAEIRRIPGNLGKPGLSFLMPPPAPKIRAKSPESWEMIDHAKFTASRDVDTDNFWQTSMHLTLTQYQPHLRELGSNANEHYIDESTFLRESLVQVHDGKHWLCDLDVLATLGSDLVSRPSCTCPAGVEPKPAVDADAAQEMAIVDNWEELLTPPVRPIPLVVRAAGNFFGRLAATGLSTRLGRHTVILPKDACWFCTYKHVEQLTKAGVDAGNIVLVL